MSDSGEVEVESTVFQAVPKDVLAEQGSVKLFNKWSYEDVEIRDISLTYVKLPSSLFAEFPFESPTIVAARIGVIWLGGGNMKISFWGKGRGCDKIAQHNGGHANGNIAKTVQDRNLLTGPFG